MDVRNLFKTKMDRRRVLHNLGLMGAGAALTACAGVVADPRFEPAKFGQGSGKIDKALLNFALNLEYLEAEFYLAAVGREPTYAPDATGPVTGGTQVTFDTPEFEDYANEIADDEENHVLFLLEVLGDDAVGRPAIDIAGGAGGAFGAAARAAGANAGLSGADLDALETFDPYANELFFLVGAFIFEDVGVTAYNGAAPIVNDAGVLEAAAGILAAEAYHASEVRTLLYGARNVVAVPEDALGPNTNRAFTVQQIVGAISSLRAALGNGKDQSIVDDRGRANIVPADENAIAFSRSPREVLNIVYGQQGADSGLFFPEGINANFPAFGVGRKGR